MSLTLFIFLLFVLQGFYWFIGRRAAKNVKGNEDYYLAGKNVRFFPLMMTFLATQVGGGMVLGAAEEAYLYGWPVLFYPLGATLGLILLGLGVGKKFATFQVSTVAQIFEQVYASVWLKKLASLLSILSLFMILVAQIIASHKFLVSLGLVNTPLFILFWAIVILYTTQGGLKAVISTDVVQGAFFSFVFFACFASLFWFNPSELSFSFLQAESGSLLSSKLTGWLLMPMLFMVIEQDMGQRCFAGASPQIVSRAALCAGIGTLLIAIVPIFLGSLAANLDLEVAPGSSVLMATIAKVSHPWMAALVGCAVLAAIISTATSLINAISSNISHDFSLGDSLRRARGATALISIAAIFFAFYFDNIVDLLIQSYELSVSCLFVPIIFALFKKNGNSSSAWMAIFAGAVGFFLFRLVPIPLPREIASLLLSLSGYGLTELYVYLFAKEKRDLVNWAAQGEQDV